MVHHISWHNHGGNMERLRGGRGRIKGTQLKYSLLQADSKLLSGQRRSGGRSLRWGVQTSLLGRLQPLVMPVVNTWSCTVEVRSLHTLRLESLTKFLLTNYSFGKAVRTSTLCMTSNYSNKCLQIISLIIHRITIPVDQKFTYTKLTVLLNSLENSRKWCHGFRSFW